jgi:hypothetical protein
MEFGWLWARVARCDANQDIVGRRLGVVRRDLPESIALEYTCIEKLEFRIVACAAGVFLA